MSGHLHRDLERARQRLRYARQQAEHFEATMDDTEAERSALRKLQDDARKAELDIAWLSHSLTQGE